MFNLPNPAVVKQADPRHTGTYHCGHTNQSLEYLNTWIHLFVSDPTDPSTVFVTPRRDPILKEGRDFLLKCLLTDPSVTNLTLQSEKWGWGLPPGMSVTVDPRSGALIRDLQRSFTGSYVCSGWKDGELVRSRLVDLVVTPTMLRPPSLSISQVEAIRLTGERFEVTCLSSNPTHSLRITWNQPNMQRLNVTNSQRYNSHLYINSTLTISEVRSEHSGKFTCTAENEAGVTTATTQLTVLEQPYLRIHLQLSQHGNPRMKSVSAKASSPSVMPQQWLTANISHSPLEMNGELIANVTTGADDGFSSIKVNGSSKVEAYEGRDLMLTFVLEAYPPIRSWSWTTPKLTGDGDMPYQESYVTNGYRSESSLLLPRVRQEDQGRFSFHFSNSFFNGSQDVDLWIYRSPTAQLSLQNDSLTCRSSGYPLPTILWFTCHGVNDSCAHASANQVSPSRVTIQEEEVRSHLSLSGDDKVTVECFASNLVGETRQVFHHRPPTFFTPALIGALASISILLLLLLVISYRWKQKPKYEIRWKIIESSDGNNYTFVDPTQLPYDHKWEFPRDKLRLGAILGSGAFGKVVEATAFGLEMENKVTRVAVKMLKPSAHTEEREALMSELKILSHLGYHDNIVNLLGACTRGGPMLMITEYCCHGDLLNFLRTHANDFMAWFQHLNYGEDEFFYKNLMTSDSTRVRSDSGISCCSDYQEMQPILSPGQTETGVFSGVHTDSLSIGDLIRFSYQVAQGLDFLSSRNCIHRDVAARNVLLTNRHIAKICDFGLARDIRNDDSYIVQGNARLPVKWMAPESIFQCIYTVQSDVWSYGVLLWEMFSLGKSPYPNVIVDANFYKMIKTGGHMARPDFAPAEMYHLMKLCWSLEPTHRPTFNAIGEIVARLLPLTDDVPLHQQVTYRNINECREEEEKGDGETLKRREEEQGHDDEEEPIRNNIYQIS
ncbi:macrophage colony-stimulating factor 1 receptor 2 [Pholidichthys leucotaenia]